MRHGVRGSCAMTDNESEVFRNLESVGGWCRPMDVGGMDGSHHSATLRRLVKRGLVERRRRPTLMNALGSHRGSYEYRIAERAKNERQP